MNRAIWARGLRNPFTFAFQPGTGRLHINDVGQNTWEEVNLGVAGANYGWPRDRRARTRRARPGVRYPVHSYQNAGSNCAIVGAAFYNPADRRTSPATFVGRYFFGDFCGGFIRTLSPPDYATSSGFATGINSLVDIAVSRGRRRSTTCARGGGGSLVRVTFTDNAGARRSPSIRRAGPWPSGSPSTFTVAASGAGAAELPVAAQRREHSGARPRPASRSPP